MPPGPTKATLRCAWRSASDGSLPSAAASRPWILEKSKPSKVLGSRLGSPVSYTHLIMFSNMNTAGTGALNAGVASTPFQIFAAGISRGMQAFRCV